MKVAVIGGIWTLAQTYEQEVRRQGHKCVQLNGYSRKMEGGLHGVDAIILFTKTVSHQAADAARALSRNGGVPLLCAQGSGVSSLRRCLSELAQTV